MAESQSLRKILGRAIDKFVEQWHGEPDYTDNLVSVVLAALSEADYAVIPAGPDAHIIKFDAKGWVLQHPLSCRPDLFSCPLNEAVDREAPCRPEGGRYECWLDNGRLVVGQHVDAAGQSYATRSTLDTWPKEPS